jgi:hypothetical protein
VLGWKGRAMGSWIRRQGPAFTIACLALMVALGGSVYAASKIDGRSVRPGSLPGNRLERASLPGNRLRPGTLRGGRIEPGSLTGVQVDAATLGKVPESTHADSADSARTANTALAADTAREASHLNGHVAGCTPAQRLFAGACWDFQPGAAATAPQAAAFCASRGGELPSALALAAFGRQLEVVLAAEGEWSGDIAIISGPDKYSLLTVNKAGVVDYSPSTAIRPFRCVIPLVG